MGLLTEAGFVGPETTIVTTVHQLQVIDEPLEHSTHDFTVDYIITPDEVIACGPSNRPPGIVWEHLDKEKIAAIPALMPRSGGRPVR